MDWCWCISSKKYVKYAILTIEGKLQKSYQTLPKNCVTSLSCEYHPAMDESDSLDSEDTACYQIAIGIPRWAVETGRIDILFEVFIISSHMAAPQEGHMRELFHTFGYLKKSSLRKIYLDSNYPKVSKNRFEWF